MAYLQARGAGQFEFQFLEQTFTLAYVDSSWRLRGRGGVDYELSPDETNAAFAIAQTSRQSNYLSASGLPFDHEPLDEWLRLRGQIRPGDVLVDTTTLAGAHLALMSPSALGLLDLSVLTFALVMSERVVVQPYSMNVSIRLPPALADAVLTLDYNHETIVGPLWTLCAELMMGLRRGPLRDEFETAWSRFFGGRSVVFDASWIDGLQHSPHYWDGVPATFFHGRLKMESSSVPDESFNKYLTIQTMRALFNDNLAGALNIPYLSTSMRTPVVTRLLAQKVETQMLADRLLSGIGSAPIREVGREGYSREFSSPFLLGVVLKRITEPGQYWDEVARLRASFAPLRQRLNDDRDQWDGRSDAYLKRLFSHLTDGTPASLKVAEDVITSTAVMAASVATASPIGSGLSKIAVKLMRGYKTTDKAYNWYLRQFRPDVAVVTSVAEEATRLRSVASDLRRLWGSSWSRREHDMLEELSVARPDGFTKLKSIN